MGKHTDNVKFLGSLDKRTRNTIIRMWVNDGPYMIADAYQNQKKCSDEEREILEKGADGTQAIVIYHMLALYAVVAVQAVFMIGKGAYKIGKFVGKHR